MSILVYFYLLILFFGPKYGIVDTRFILIPVGFFLSMGYIWNSKVLKFSFTFLTILLLYSFLLYLLNHFTYPDFLRYFRGIVSVLALGLLFNSKFVGYKKILNGFFYVFLTHALVMLVMLLFPDSQPHIHKLMNFEIVPRHWRVTGLTAGFDIAGIITVATAVFSYIMLEMKNNTRYVLLMLLSIVMTIFTSRTNMIYLALLFLFLILRYLFKTSHTKRELLVLSTFLLIAIIFIYRMVIPIFQQTINTQLFNFGSGSDVDYISASYNYVDPFKTLKSFIVLPETAVGLIFGSSRFPFVDSGYIQTINAIGILGLLFSLLFYSWIYFVSRSFYWRVVSQTADYMEPSAFLGTSAIIFFLTIVASVKNQYFFTRTVFEMFIFCASILEYFCTSASKNAHSKF